MEARADDIRPYTRTRISRFHSYQRVARFGLLRKSGCRGGYHVKRDMVYSLFEHIVYNSSSSVIFRIS